MKRFFLLSFFLSFGLYSQDYFIVNDGVKTKEYGNTAFTNANIYTDKGVISNSTLIINDGKIINYGRNIDIPKNTVLWSTLFSINSNSCSLDHAGQKSMTSMSQPNVRK